MKTSNILVLCIIGFAAFLLLRTRAVDNQPHVEYVTIRWGGKENIHLIRPGGQVEFIGMEVRKFQRPDRADERSFYMNAAMNGLSKEGYEFAGMTSDEIVMKRLQ
jgi:hypothetical protein